MINNLQNVVHQDRKRSHYSVFGKLFFLSPKDGHKSREIFPWNFVVFAAVSHMACVETMLGTFTIVLCSTVEHNSFVLLENVRWLFFVLFPREKSSSLKGNKLAQGSDITASLWTWPATEQIRPIYNKLQDCARGLKIKEGSSVTRCARLSNKAQILLQGLYEFYMCEHLFIEPLVRLCPIWITDNFVLY